MSMAAKAKVVDVVCLSGTTIQHIKNPEEVAQDKTVKCRICGVKFTPRDGKDPTLCGAYKCRVRAQGMDVHIPDSREAYIRTCHVCGRFFGATREVFICPNEECQKVKIERKNVPFSYSKKFEKK